MQPSTPFFAMLSAGRRLSRVIVPAGPVILFISSLHADDVGFARRDGAVLVSIRDQVVARYVYQDSEIPRPYFCDVRTVEGIPVTRHHPPLDGQDATDHATMHPGIWLAFGDLNGTDFWRNKGRVVHDGFVESPRIETNRGTFTIRNRYCRESPDADICRETCRYTFLVHNAGYLLIWDSTFEALGREIYFGDQEEMGLGIRLATSIAVSSERGGRILDSQGRLNEAGIWGRQADWCDYSGTAAGHRVGVTIMTDPDNFRTCWWHSRDYGLMTANPFGRRAFTRGLPSRVVVEPGKPFHLRFGIFVHTDRPDYRDADMKTRLDQVYEEFKQAIRPTGGG